MNNPLSSLSTEELRKIQQGKRTLGTIEAAAIVAQAIAAELFNRNAPNRRAHQGVSPAFNAMPDLHAVRIAA